VSAPVYTRRLCATRGLANTTTVCFIAGVGTTVLRDIFIDATQEAGMNTYVLILRLTGGGDYFLVNGPDTTLEILHLELRQVMVAGDQLLLYNTSADREIRVLATGYVFD
jgi:hypothetical protein